MDGQTNVSPNAISFLCPNCGKISRDDVIFLCNHCKQEDLIEKNGIYMCPSCLTPGENFECMLCASTEVKMVSKDRVPHKNASE